MTRYREIRSLPEGPEKERALARVAAKVPAPAPGRPTCDHGPAAVRRDNVGVDICIGCSPLESWEIGPEGGTCRHSTKSWRQEKGLLRLAIGGPLYPFESLICIECREAKIEAARKKP